MAKYGVPGIIWQDLMQYTTLMAIQPTPRKRNPAQVDRRQRCTVARSSSAKDATRGP